MAFPIAWTIGSFIGGLLAKEFYNDVIATHSDDVEEEKTSDEVLMTLLAKLKKEQDAKGLYDFGLLLEDDNKYWAREFIKAAADMDFMIAQHKLRVMDAM